MAVTADCIPDSDAASVESMQCLLDVADQASTSEEIIEQVLWKRLLVFRQKLSLILAHTHEDRLSNAILTLYNKLQAPRQARILLGCEFYECYTAIEQELRHGTKLDAPDVVHLYLMLFDAIQREHAIQTFIDGGESLYMKTSRARELWSPVGDVRISRDADGVWSLQASPMIGDVVAVDFDSPVSRNHEPRSGVLSQTLLDFTDEERCRVVEKLQEAMDIIDHLTPRYGFLIRNCVRRVVVRKSVKEGDYEPTKLPSGVFGSEHVHRQPGAIRVLNPHLPEFTTAQCVERLLHESTHTFLAAWETVNGPFVVNDEKFRAASPWSGNLIPNSSFVHATFIYYMCHILFEDLAASPFAERPDIKNQVLNRLTEFGSGFLIHHSLYDQLLLKSEPKHAVRRTLEELQGRMKRQYGYQ